VQFERVISAGAGSEQAYRTFSALLNESRIVLCDNPELVKQLRQLSDKVTDGNRFLVEGRRGAKDDAAVACILAAAFSAENLEVREPLARCLSIYGEDDEN
jgi:hypothetical protein